MNNIQIRQSFFSSAAIALAISVSACGGGSSSSNSNSPSPIDFTPVVTQTGIIAFTEDQKIDQAAELFLYYPDDNLTNISWQQTAGSNLVFHAENSKAIAFTPTAAGEYSLQVNFFRNGANETLTHSFSVSEQNSEISARLGHAALEGSKVSLRASLDNANLTNASIEWQQVSGPTINFSETTAGKSAVFFTAPAVSADSLLEFTVSASDGSSRYQDTVAILIEDAPTISSNSNTAYDTRLATVFPFNANSPYADVLADCVYSNSIDFRTTCRLNELPLIAQDTTTPNLDNIMDRVLVSHRWMGQRFKEFLQTSDPHSDFKNLLRATTAIVISYDVRPSYYWAVTGAIHLDPNDLWLTADERDTINQTPDYRASFGNDLDFVMPWRFVKNNAYASFSYPEDQRVTRDAADGIHDLASLLYHELAHANDYFPQSEWANLNRGDRILDAVEKLQQGSGIDSDKLSTALPLHGAEMYRLAQVRYHGETATATERAYNPSDVAGFFSPEHAPHFYNYSSKREDYAMLFDELMMKARFDVDRDIAVTNQPNTGEEYIVTWGQRGRIGETNIKPRVDYVTRRILPEYNQASDFINNLAAPIAMQPGKTWAENLTISPLIDPNIDNVKQPSIDANAPLTQAQRIRINADGSSFYEKPMPTRNR
ncbi:MAG: hypothetical protein ACPG52_06180 [Cognaticolwellia sp.]